MSILKTELDNLCKQYLRTEDRLQYMVNNLWSGICCPSCGVPGYSDLEDKQERRLVRMKQLRVKLFKDSAVAGPIEKL